MEENKLDVKKAFDAIAKILSEREGIQITVKEIRKKEKKDEKSA